MAEINPTQAYNFSDALSVWGINPNPNANANNSPYAPTTPLTSPESGIGSGMQGYGGFGQYGSAPTTQQNQFGFGDALSKYGAPAGEALKGIAGVGQVYLGYQANKQNQQAIDNAWDVAKMNAYNKGVLAEDAVARREKASNNLGFGHTSGLKLRNLDNVG